MNAAEVAEPPPRARPPARVTPVPRPGPGAPSERPAVPAGPPSPPLEIPADAHTLDGFHRWLEADGCPPGYRATFLRGRLLLGPTVDDLFLHNRVKTFIAVALGPLELDEGLGFLFTDPARFRNVPAGVGSEPDAMFVLTASVEAGRVAFEEEVHEGTGKRVLVTGSPDLVVEVVSDSSVAKDTVDLRAGYLAAGVREYWLIDARADPCAFELLSAPGGAGDWSERGPDSHGYRFSPVLGRRVRLDRDERPVGGPRWSLRLEE